MCICQPPKQLWKYRCVNIVSDSYMQSFECAWGEAWADDTTHNTTSPQRDFQRGVMKEAKEKWKILNSCGIHSIRTFIQ